MAVRPIDGTWSKFVWNLSGSESLARKFRDGKACLVDLRLAVEAQPTIPPPNKPLTCGLVDRHGAPLRALDTVAADKFFVYAVRYGSHNVNPDNCAPAFQVGWYLEIVWAYPGFEDSVGRTEPLYDIDGVAARYPAHCADTTDGIDNLKFEKVTRRPPEGEEAGNG